MKIQFHKLIVPGKSYPLVVEIAPADLGRKPGSQTRVEVRLVAPGFSVAPNVKQRVAVKGQRGILKCAFVLRVADARRSGEIRADLFVNGVLAGAATTSAVILDGSESATLGVARRREIARPPRPTFGHEGSLGMYGVSPGAGVPPKRRRSMSGKKKGGGGGGRRVRSARPMRAARRRSIKKASPALSAAEAQTVSREPRIEFHELVEAGKANDLTVRLSDAISHVERERLVEVEIPGGKETVEVTVRLSAPGFKVKPKPEKTLKIGREFNAEREQATFTLTANDPGEQPITREIRADFWLGNNCVGAATHRTQVIPAGYTGPMQGDGSGRHTAFELKDDRQECDLVIIVSSTKDDGAPPFDISLQSQIPGADYPFRPMGRLSMTPRKLSQTLNGVFAKFTSAYPVNGSAKQVTQWRESMRDAIETLGKYLWGQLPAKFQQEYFRLHDAGLLPKSIQVHSDEMLVPWELLIPNRPTGKVKVLKPLGVMHVMGRWRPGIGIQPRPQQMRVKAASIVNPKYAGGNQLLWSIVEATDLRKAHPVFTPLEPPTRAQFKNLLKRKDVQVIHYTGHGRYTANQSDLSSLELQGGDLLDAIDFVAAKLLSEGKALVYLNACEAGNVGIAMGQMGGFAVQCVTNGSSGVIAPYWSVVDGKAREFSLAFYGMLSKGRSIGEALKELRAKHPKDPTFMAFSYFGDPWTRLQF